MKNYSTFSIQEQSEQGDTNDIAVIDINPAGTEASAQTPLLPPAQHVHYLQTEKQLVLKVLPIFINRFIATIGGFAGGALLSKFGEDQLIAGSFIVPTQLLLVVVGGASLNSVGVIAGRSFGTIKRLERNGEESTPQIQEQKKLLSECFQQGMVLGVLTSIPAMGVMWFSEDLFLKLGQSPDISRIIGSYFRAYMWGVPAAAWGVVARQYSLSLNLNKMNFINSIVGLSTVVGLGYILTFGNEKISWLPFGPYKEAGFAYACTAQAWLNCLMYLFSYFKNPTIAAYNPLSAKFLSSFHQLKELWLVGWPVMVQIGGEMALYFADLFFIQHFKNNEIPADLAASNILTQYESLLVTFPFALSQACSIIVSQEKGKNNKNEIIAVGKMTLLTSASISLLTFMMFSLFRKPLSKAFLTHDDDAFNKEVLSILNSVFIIMCAGHVVDAARHCVTGYLRGLKDTRTPMFINLGILSVVGCVLSWVLGISLGMDLDGLALASGIAILCALSMLSVRTYSQSKALDQTPAQEIRTPAHNQHRWFSRTSPALPIHRADSSSEASSSQQGSFFSPIRNWFGGSSTSANTLSLN